MVCLANCLWRQKTNVMSNFVPSCIWLSSMKTCDKRLKLCKMLQGGRWGFRHQSVNQSPLLPPLFFFFFFSWNCLLRKIGYLSTMEMNTLWKKRRKECHKIHMSKSIKKKKSYLTSLKVILISEIFHFFECFCLKTAAACGLNDSLEKQYIMLHTFEAWLTCTARL